MNQDNINNSSTSTDIQNQQAIDQALIDAGLPQNKLNGLVSMISDKLICDSACQTERNEIALQKKWDLAQNNLVLAPGRVDEAERNYYIFTQGEQGYIDMVYQRNNQIAQQFKNGKINDYQKDYNDVNVLLNTYNSDKDYEARLTELLNIKIEEEKELELEIDKYLAKVQTSGRKVVYEKTDMGWVNLNRKFFLFIYYSLFVYYLSVSDYFPTAKYKNIKVWILILVYFIFPHLVDWISKKLFAIYDYIVYVFLNRKYKNVYLSLDS
jgi:hypothetical protein